MNVYSPVVKTVVATTLAQNGADVKMDRHGVLESCQRYSNGVME